MLGVTVAKYAVALSLLTVASYEDIKSREISNKIWVVFIFFAILFNFIMFYLKFISLSFYDLIIFILQFLLFSFLYHFNAYGGADLKALVCLTFMFPFSQEKTSILGYGIVPLPILVFFYASFLSLFYTILNLIHNVVFLIKYNSLFDGVKEPVWKKFLALFLLRKTKVRKEDVGIFFLPAEKNTKEGKKLILFPKLQEKELANEEIIFTSPLIPFQVPILLALLLFMLFGDFPIVSFFYPH